MQYYTEKVMGTCCLIFILCGCSNISVKPDVSLPANLMTECRPLSKLDGMTGADILRNITENASTFYECADKHKALIEAVRPEKK